MAFRMSFIKDIPNKDKEECFVLHPWYIIKNEAGAEYKICSRCGHGRISLFTDVFIGIDEDIITELQEDEEYRDLPGSELL